MSAYTEQRLAEIKGPELEKIQTEPAKPKARTISAKTRRRATKTLTESLAQIYHHKRRVAAALEVLGLIVTFADDGSPKVLS